jgi:hypothetical protein
MILIGMTTVAAAAQLPPGGSQTTKRICAEPV